MIADADTAPITSATLEWFAGQGLSRATLEQMTALRVARGTKGRDGWFDVDPAGRLFVVFFESASDDVVFWCPTTAEIATWRGRAFALGEEDIKAASTYDFGGALTIRTDPFEWLRGDGRGIVVIDWSRAFDMLRDAPRVEIPETLLPRYRRWMKPAHMPDVTVVREGEQVAA